ncbi:MAG: type IV pilus assembly protein PilM [Thermodesulfobacteriota bacterium]
MAAKGKLLIGLDIGSSAVKMVELRDSKQGYFLNKFGLQPLPADVVVEGEVVDSAPVVEAIRKLRSQLGIGGKDVAASITCKWAVIKKISLPPMADFELEEQILYEAEQHVPFDIEEVYLDYQRVEEISPDKEEMEVLLVAAKREFVERHRGVLREAGLNCLVMDVDVFALNNIYEANYPPSDEVVALVDLGASVMKVNVVAEGMSAFNRDVPLGSQTLDREIQNQFNLSVEQAEAVKRGEEVEGIPPAEVETLVQNYAMGVVTEVENSFEFFLATPFGKAIDAILITGGGSKTKDLIPLMSERTGLPVEMLNPCALVDWDKRKYSEEQILDVAPFISVGMGLALRRIKEK